MNRLNKLKIAFIVIISFLFSFKILALEPQIIINEIAWMGTGVSSSDEWIELKNNTPSDIDLTGWILMAQDGTPTINLLGAIPATGYFLLERTDDNSVPSILASQIYVGAMGNSGEVLELRDNENNLIDIVDASIGWQTGDNALKLTMEKVDEGWQNSQNAGGTPKAKNSIVIINDAEVAQEDDVQESASSTEITTEDEEDFISYKLGDVVINEFVSDPADGQQEFIELFNNLKEEINLDNWTIEEGSGVKTSLSGTIKASEFFVIEKPKGNLNNKGDIIILRDANNSLIDKVAYGKWEDGSLDNNAPVATDPYSVARKFDGHNTYNNANDFAVTTTITKNSLNIIAEINKDDEGGDNIKDYDYSNNIIISEIFPNPLGKDNEDEFIELYNKGEKDITLIGWKIGDNSKRKHALKKDKQIKAGEYLVIYRKESKIALNNSGDIVKLFQPLQDKVYLKAEYQKSIENWSFNFDINNNKWVWSEVITPGKENNIKKINHSPIVDFDFKEIAQIATPIIFDSSDTIDEDDDALKYFWNFGDGFTNILPNPEHTFFTAGVYNIKLTVSDGENEISKEKIIKVIDKSIGFDSIFPATTTVSNIIISEILPNPYGADSEGEWIELYNKGDAPVNLFNWSIDDGEGGSKPYKIKDDIWLKANEYHIVDREDSKIGLNNNGIDFVRLYDNFDELVAEVQYDKTFEGESYMQGENGEWFWTTILTPGYQNQSSIFNDQFLINTEQQLWIDPIAELQENNNQYIKISLENIKDFLKGDLVEVSGIVAVKPGVLGTQYFYIVLDRYGVQVYNYKKNFPSLQIGDYIKVMGEVSFINEEVRIKTKIKDDIKIIEKREEPLAQIITSEEVSEDMAGKLVQITGEVVERKGSSIYLDDGIGEVLVYIKSNTGISAKSIKEGANYSITGIASRTKSNIRVLPRFANDFILKDAESVIGLEQKMPGKVLENNNLLIAQRDKKLKLFQYLLVVSGGVILVLGGLLFRVK